MSSAAAGSRTTGSGAFTFRVRDLALPQPMREHLAGAHGAFVQDRESEGGDGATWFGLKGVGLVRIDPELGAVEVVGGDRRLREANIHGGCIVRDGGDTYLALASNEAEAVWLADRDGRIVRTFANPHGPGGAPFNVCDVELIDGRLIATNGYADDLCFTADPLGGTADDPSLGAWEAARFGGKGPAHGRFATAHGVTRVPGTNVFTIADRRNARLETFAPGGRYVGGIGLEAATMPCSVDYHDRLALVACLRGPGETTPAPIYVFEDGNLVAELNLGRDLGLEGFAQIHNAVFRVLERPDGSRRFHVLVTAWNPGGLVVLEQADPS